MHTANGKVIIQVTNNVCLLIRLAYLPITLLTHNINFL
jgi:hypothetical protein